MPAPSRFFLLLLGTTALLYSCSAAGLAQQAIRDSPVPSPTALARPLLGVRSGNGLILVLCLVGKPRDRWGAVVAR